MRTAPAGAILSAMKPSSWALIIALSAVWAADGSACQAKTSLAGMTTNPSAAEAIVSRFNGFYTGRLTGPVEILPNVTEEGCEDGFSIVNRALSRQVIVGEQEWKLLSDYHAMRPQLWRQLSEVLQLETPDWSFAGEPAMSGTIGGSRAMPALRQLQDAAF